MSTPQRKNNSIAVFKKNQKRLIKKAVKDTLLQFKLCELLSDTIANLFELNPEEVKEKITELKLLANKGTVADLLSHRSQAFSLQELEDIYYSLKLYRIVFTRKTKTWKTISLSEPAEDFQCYGDVKTITLNILQALRIKGLNAIVKVFEHEDLIWTMIIEKKLTRGKGVKLKPPVFFCFEVGMPFIFVLSSIKTVILNCVLKALQYQRHKVRNLQGRDVKSLLSLLKHKADYQGDIASVDLPTEPEFAKRCVDYTKRKVRKKYAETVFKSKEPIILETYTVQAEGCMRETAVVPSIVGETFRASLVLTSKNVIELMKYSVVENIVTTPVPNYLQAILGLGKNKIDVRVSK